MNLSELSNEELAAQLMVIGFDGTRVNDHLAAWLKRGVGGVILFRRNVGSPEEILALCREIHERARLSPPIISIDQEPGLIVRLRAPFTEWPGAAALGATGDEKLIEEVGAAIARELKAVGINTDWAPVADVHSNPKNPIIGPRAFATSPEEAGRLSRAFIRGMQGADVAACAKHFPGHGDTATDSHISLPVVKRARNEIEATELPPFAACAAEHVASMMSAHVLYPEIDPENPATISPAIITGILREKLGYDGVVVTDDLAMAGIAAGRRHEQIAVDSVRAGCDILLAGQDFPNQERYLRGVANAVESGALSRERVEQSVARILALKEKFVAIPPESVPEDVIGCAAHQALAARASAV
ncbi:MAG: beta-N-acetylhexosaminidase [Chrysiogenetes bacterium]|nr:beta-N-acetylhexosaminidase [Chrysiogenetes bacterium]